MRKHILKYLVTRTATLAMFAAAGCLGHQGSSDPNGTTDPNATDPSATDPNGTAPGKPAPPNPLDARVIDYGQALRTAALKLVGDLPTVAEINGVTDAVSYAAQVDKYLADPRLPRQLLSYFQDSFKMGGNLSVTIGQTTSTVSLDTAPTFAAELVVQDRAFTDLFTATTNTCPTLNKTTGAFTDASCAVASGAVTSGVLTNPGAMATMFSNMSFRRVRWLQESFVCTKFPAEYAAKATPMGNGQYISPWPFTSITGGTDKTVAPIDFQDTSSVVCANCHTTMNHVAPLLAHFNAAGVYQTTIQVNTPTPTNPITKLTDWLPATETTYWRLNVPAASLTELGQAMAKDPDVAECQVARAWNWAMSKTDIVTDLSVVPTSTIASLVTQFSTGGYKLKPVLKAIFTHDDFVKF